MSEIKWSILVYRAGALVVSAALSTIDLSFPAAYVQRLADEYHATKIVVIDSRGRIHEKTWP